MIKKLLVCVSAVLLLTGCAKKPSEAEIASATETVNSVLRRSSNAFEKADSVALNYTRNTTFDSSKELYDVKIASVRSSGTTLEQGSQTLTNTTTILNPIFEYFYDDDSGKRYSFDEEGRQIGSFPVTGPLIEAENTPKQLLKQYKDGLVPLNLEEANGHYVVVGNAFLPDLCSIEETFERPKSYSWKVLAEFDKETYLPITVKYRNENEEIAIEYTSFDEVFDINIPDKEGGDDL